MPLSFNKKLFDKAQLIFLLPPSLETLKDRLKKRNLDTSESIEKRFLEAKKEIEKSREYDFLILNDDFNRALADLKLILFEEITPKNFKSRVRQELVKRLVE